MVFLLILGSFCIALFSSYYCAYGYILGNLIKLTGLQLLYQKLLKTKYSTVHDEDN